MWRRVLVCLIVCLVAVAGVDFADAAAKKKKTKKAPAPPAVTKPIYEAPMRVVIVRSGNTACEPLCPEWIAAEGEITGATPAAFSKVFKQMGKRKLPVIIRSPGGSITAALDIGRMIRTRGLDVSLGWTSYTGCAPDNKGCALPKEQKGIYRGLVFGSRAFCNSACHLVLAGGIKRLAPYGTYVGVHQPKTVWTRETVYYRERYRMVKGKKKIVDRKVVSRKPGKSRVTFGYDKALRKKLTAYYKDMGINPKVLEEADKAEFKDINYLSGSELQELNLRTLPAGPETLAGPKTCNVSPVPGNCVKTIGGESEANAKSTNNIQSSIEQSVKVYRRERTDCSPTCPTWIAIQGKITGTTPFQFRHVLDFLAGRKLPVLLNSTGGDYNAAVEIGGLVHKHRLEVYVAETRPVDCSAKPDVCGSTVKLANVATPGETAVCKGVCIFVLAAGEKRSASSSAAISIINPKGMVPEVLHEVIETQIPNFLSSLSFSREMYRMLGHAPLDSVRTLSAEDLRKSGLINSTAKLDSVVGRERCAVSGPPANCFRMN